MKYCDGRSDFQNEQAWKRSDLGLKKWYDLGLYFHILACFHQYNDCITSGIVISLKVPSLTFSIDYRRITAYKFLKIFDI